MHWPIFHNLPHTTQMMSTHARTDRFGPNFFVFTAFLWPLLVRGNPEGGWCSQLVADNCQDEWVQRRCPTVCAAVTSTTVSEAQESPDVLQQIVELCGKDWDAGFVIFVPLDGGFAFTPIGAVVIEASMPRCAMNLSEPSKAAFAWQVAVTSSPCTRPSNASVGASSISYHRLSPTGYALRWDTLFSLSFKVPLSCHLSGHYVLKLDLFVPSAKRRISFFDARIASFMRIAPRAPAAACSSGLAEHAVQHYIDQTPHSFCPNIPLGYAGPFLGYADGPPDERASRNDAHAPHCTGLGNGVGDARWAAAVRPKATIRPQLSVVLASQSDGRGRGRSGHTERLYRFLRHWQRLAGAWIYF